MTIANQQQSPDEGNVQRLERKLVPLNGETENTLNGEDIVQYRWKKEVKPKEAFLAKASKKYGDKFTYDLTNYAGLTKNKITIVCPIHGAFEQVPHVFLLKNCLTGCYKCGHESKNKSKTRSYNNFLECAKKIHGDRYVYPENNNYLNRKSKVIIVCKVHGNFIKSGQKHLSGQGCHKCNAKRLVDEGILVGGYNKRLFINTPRLKTKPATLYYLKINDGEYYKIGITTKSVKGRIKGIKCKSKKEVKLVEILWTSEDTLLRCYNKEQRILRKFKDKRVSTSWSKELFNFNVLPIKLISI